jgi:hypothetical protein
MSLRSLTLAAVALATSAPALVAQAPPAPPPLKLPAGLHVHVWTLSLPNQRVEGTLLAADATGISLVPKGTHPLVTGEMRLPAEDVTRLDVALEKKRHWWQGALIGAAVGLAIALSDDVDPALCKVNENVACSRGDAILTYGVGMTAIGAGVGALIQTEQWTPVALDAFGPPPAKRVRESRGPLALELSVRF